MERRRPSLLVVLVTAVASAVIFGTVVLLTGFAACGVSGCSGAGFGPSFAPVQAQVGLLAAGLSLVPLALVCLSVRGRWWCLIGATLAVVVGSVLAMTLLRLGPDGCPSDQSRATSGAAAFSPGSPTCSGDPDAVPPAGTA